MRRASILSGLVLIFALAVSLDTSATTCVANKIFKVRHVCGRVVDPTGAPIPSVEVELLDTNSRVLRKAVTSESGAFDVQNVPSGQYVIRVQFAGFATAWQPFVLTENKPNARCNKPMEVHLALAGRCSSVTKLK